MYIIPKQKLLMAMIMYSFDENVSLSLADSAANCTSVISIFRMNNNYVIWSEQDECISLLVECLRRFPSIRKEMHEDKFRMDFIGSSMLFKFTFESFQHANLKTTKRPCKSDRYDVSPDHCRKVLLLSLYNLIFFGSN